VAEILLKQSEAHSGLEEVCRVRMPQRVHRDTLLEAEPGDHPAQRVLQAPRIHRARGGRPLIASVAEEGEEPHGITVRLPIDAQASERRLREGDVAVARPLASVDVKHHAPSVDILDLEVHRLLEPKTAGVCGPEERLVVEAVGGTDDSADLFDFEDDWEADLLAGAHQSEGAPLALQREGEEELHAAVGDLHGAGGEGVLVLEMQEVLAEFLLADFARRLVHVFAQLPDLAKVRLLRALGEASELHVLHHPAVQFGHDLSPFL